VSCNWNYVQNLVNTNSETTDEMYIVEIQPSYMYLIYKAFLSKTTARE